MVLNTWEAVYFDHRLERLTELAEVAARLGVERFVLDDGWFGSRRNDRAGLGDWHVAVDVWPEGLNPLISHVRKLGMEFGLWVEPEMVNPDSDLFRAHPDWVLSGSGRPGRLPEAWRNQQVLDLANPDCWAFIRDRLDALLADHDIAFLKWDHNRDLIEAGHGGRPGVHAQTLAVYRLLDELRRRHPGVEIESCASGGGRVDLGILARTDRVWASDTNDALERQHIQRWTQLLVPPELVGSHVGPPRSHTTGRTHDLGFRVATALFGHFGIEWDIASASEEEQQALAEAIAVYKRLRPLLHGGQVVRADHPNPAAYLHGVVAPDRAEALFAYVQLTASAFETPGLARLPGLDPDRAYRVTPLAVAGEPQTKQAVGPPLDRGRRGHPRRPGPGRGRPAPARAPARAGPAAAPDQPMSAAERPRAGSASATGACRPGPGPAGRTPGPSTCRGAGGSGCPRGPTPTPGSPTPASTTPAGRACRCRPTGSCTATAPPPTPTSSTPSRSTRRTCPPRTRPATTGSGSGCPRAGTPSGPCCGSRGPTRPSRSG